MTDPITQDQNQNVQNVQNPQISQTETPEIDFDLNLPTSEETSSTEEPVVSLDFSDLGTIETTQNETQQPKIEETPAIVEENQPKAEELQQNIINSIDNISLGQSPSTTQPVEEIIQKDVVVNLPTEQANDSETIQTEQTNKVSSEVIKTQPEIIETTPETIQPGEEINEVNSEVIEVQPETTEVQPEATEVQPEATTNPIDEITTELPPVPVEEVVQQPEAKDNRLDQEDALVAQEKQPSEETPVITTKEIPEIKTETLNIFEEPSNSQEDMLQENTNKNTASAIVTESNEEIQNEQQPMPTESNSETFSTPETSKNISTIQNNEQEKPAPGQPEQNFPPSANLEQDQMIIQQLQASAGKTTEVVPVPTTPAATEVNLDDLLNSPAPQQTNDIQNPTINIPNNPTLNTQNTTQIPNPAQNTLPAFTGVQGFSLPPITQQLAQQAKQPLNKKILINFGIGIIALVVGGFMFKTMYPLEYQKLMGKSENTASIENTLATTS